MKSRIDKVEELKIILEKNIDEEIKEIEPKNYWLRFLVGIIAVLFILPIACTADPLVVDAKLRPERPAVGDVVGIYITLLGQQNESIQVFTKLKSPMFKVTDALSKKDLPYNTVKPNTIDFRVSKGQIVEVTIIGVMPDTKTLAVIFPNAYRIDSPSIHQKETTLTSQKNESAVQSEQLSKRSQLMNRYGKLFAEYQNTKGRIPERLQLIIEEKFRIAKGMIENGKLEEATIMIDEIDGLLEPFMEPDNSSTIILATAILAVIIAVGAIFVWRRYYQPNRRELEEDEFQKGSLRLLR